MRLKRSVAILFSIFLKNKSEDFLPFTESFYHECMLNISISSLSSPTSYILLHYLKWSLHSFLYQFGHFYRELKMSILSVLVVVKLLDDFYTTASKIPALNLCELQEQT